jgi:hypothetical protein
MSSPITGVNGKVCVGAAEVADVRGFSVPRESDVKSYASSSTGGYEKTVSGNRRWRFSMSLYCPDGSLSMGFEVGDLVTVKGYTTTGKYFEGQVRVRSIEPEVDIERGELIGCTVAGIGHGQYTLTG